MLRLADLISIIQHVYTTFSFADNAVGFANLAGATTTAAPVLALKRGSTPSKRSIEAVEEILLARSEPADPVPGVLRHKRAARPSYKL